MARKIIAYVATNVHGSKIEEEYELPENWDDFTPQEQERELEEIARLHLVNHADFGAYVSED